MLKQKRIFLILRRLLDTGDGLALSANVSEMNFEARYGKIGRDFIHVHHKRPLSSLKKQYKVDPKKDLVPVCPNCHAMLHRRTPPYDVEQLRAIIRDA